jgi:hypothetical protein
MCIWIYNTINTKDKKRKEKRIKITNSVAYFYLLDFI